MQEAWRAEADAREREKLKGQNPKFMTVDELRSSVESVETREEYHRRMQEARDELLRATGEPVDLSKYKEPVMYYEPAEGTGGLPASICTCGWSKRHLRLKVLKKASEKHYTKTGHKPADPPRD